MIGEEGDKLSQEEKMQASLIKDAHTLAELSMVSHPQENVQKAMSLVKEAIDALSLPHGPA